MQLWQLTNSTSSCHAKPCQILANWHYNHLSKCQIFYIMKSLFHALSLLNNRVQISRPSHIYRYCESPFCLQVSINHWMDEVIICTWILPCVYEARQTLSVIVNGCCNTWILHMAPTLDVCYIIIYSDVTMGNTVVLHNCNAFSLPWKIWIHFLWTILTCLWESLLNHGSII